MDLRSEAELRQEIASLRRRLEDAQADMEHMKGLAELGRLAGSVAHEIRNPLTALVAAAEVLQSRFEGDERAGRLTAVIVEDAARIEKIISDLVAYARDVKGEPGPVAVGEVVESVRQDLQEQLEKAGIRLRATVPPGAVRAMTQLQHLTQVLRNVVDNCVQAMPSGGEVAIDVERRMDPREGDRVLVKVRDTGPGVPEDKLQVIFEPFYTTKTRGVGLGLAVCRKLLRHAGGRIEAMNNPDGGLTVAIDLRAADEP